MRSAVVSGIMLAAVILAFVILSILIDSHISSIISRADALPAFPDEGSETAESIKNIESEWKKYRRLISIGIADEHIEKIDKDLISVRSYFKANENGGYMSAVDLLKEDLDRLRNVYRLELSDIF